MRSYASVEEELWNHYVARGAEPWNVSLEAAWLDYELRAWVGPRLPPAPASVCNVGIGTGLWDDWLGHVLGRSLTSVDRDPNICRVFALRQRIERHPHPAQVICGDVLDGVIVERRFDAITVVGSTIAEGNPPGAVEQALRAVLAPGGALLIAEVGVGAAPAGADLRRLGSTWIAFRELPA